MPVAEDQLDAVRADRPDLDDPNLGNAGFPLLRIANTIGTPTGSAQSGVIESGVPAAVPFDIEHAGPRMIADGDRDRLRRVNHRQGESG